MKGFCNRIRLNSREVLCLNHQGQHHIKNSQPVTRRRHPEPASGHQILCARCTRDPDLASSPPRLACREPQVPPHAGLGSRRLRQDDVTVCLGTIIACKPSPGGLGISGGTVMHMVGVGRLHDVIPQSIISSAILLRSG